MHNNLRHCNLCCQIVRLKAMNKQTLFFFSTVFIREVWKECKLVGIRALISFKN